MSKLNDEQALLPDNERDSLFQAAFLQMEALRESPDAQTVAAIERWMRESPMHAAAFLRELTIDDAIREMGSQHGLAEWIRIRREAYRAEGLNVSCVEGPAQSRQRNGRRSWWRAAADRLGKSRR